MLDKELFQNRRFLVRYTRWSISGRRSVAGWYSGTARDAQETLAFSVLSAVHPMIEPYPLGRVAEAYEQMHSGRVRFRVVLTVDE